MGWGGGVSMTHQKQPIPLPSPMDLTIGYTPPPVPLGQYSEGNSGFYDVPVIVITPQKSNLNTKYKSSLLNFMGGVSCSGLCLDVQWILLSTQRQSQHMV